MWKCSGLATDMDSSGSSPYSGVPGRTQIWMDVLKALHLVVFGLLTNMVTNLDGPSRSSGYSGVPAWSPTWADLLGAFSTVVFQLSH